MVDWSAGNDRGPTPKRDSIWLGTVILGREREPVYLRNRQVAEAHLHDLVADELAAGRRLCLGLDFPFGYPKGFAARVTGNRDTRHLWDWFAAELEDTPQRNNRFEIAGRLNALFPGVGPFWFNGRKTDILNLPRKGRARLDHGLPERRRAEDAAKGAFPLWQMGGAGAVGGQAMTGMAALSRLRRAFPGQVSVWPFEGADAPVQVVEIWPSLIDAVVKQAGDPIRDRAQVRLLARALAALPPERLAVMLDVNAPEEGWILGLGFETELMEAACRN